MTPPFESIRDSAANFQNKWKPTYNWDNCKLQRKEYGQFIASYVSRENRSLVLNLNGTWGSGKTEFLKRLYTELRVQKHACVYIDAWESDFSKNPLVVVSSELIEQLGHIENHLRGSFNGIRNALGQFLRNTTPEIAGLLSQAILGTSTPAKVMTESLLKSISNKDVINKLSSTHRECIDALYAVKNQLGNLSKKLVENGYKPKIIILIDELDRCRPTYAIELLEVIKHFFNVPNFSFVIATDTEQLGHSIKAIYGNDFDSTRYLRRFFDQKLELPIPSIEHYLSSKDINLNPNAENISLVPANLEKEITFEIIAGLFDAYNLKIRDIDQLLNKFNACVSAAIDDAERSNTHQVIHWFILFFALIEHDECHDIFLTRSNNNTPSPKAPNNIQLFKSNHSKGISIENLITQGVSFVTIKERTKQQINRRVDAINHEKRALKNNNDRLGSYFRKMANDLVNNTNQNYWLWTSYKSMVELAGYLDDVADIKSHQ